MCTQNSKQKRHRNHSLRAVELFPNKKLDKGSFFQWKLLSLFYMTGFILIWMAHNEIIPYSDSSEPLTTHSIFQLKAPETFWASLLLPLCAAQTCFQIMLRTQKERRSLLGSVSVSHVPFSSSARPNFEMIYFFREKERATRKPAAAAHKKYQIFFRAKFSFGYQLLKAKEMFFQWKISFLLHKPIRRRTFSQWQKILWRRAWKKIQFAFKNAFRSHTFYSEKPVTDDDIKKFFEATRWLCLKYRQPFTVRWP